MTYSDLYFRSKSRPSVFLVIFAILAVGGFASLFIRFDSTPTQASKSPLKIHQLVNISHNQIGVFWQSEKAETGWILYGNTPDQLITTAYDDRDLSTQKNKTKNHYVLLKNLDQDRTYYYKIVSDSQVYMANNSEPFTAKTILPFTSPNALKPAYGKIVLANGDAAADAFVFIYPDNAYPLLAETKVTGEFLIPLQYAVGKADLKPNPLNDTDTVNMTILNEEGDHSSVKALIKKINPLPNSIVLGKDYTFLEQQDVLPASTVRNTDSQKKIDVIYPRDNAVIPGAKPLIKGTALPETDVSIKIDTKPVFSTTVTPDIKGDWKVAMPAGVTNGRYTLTVSTLDQQKHTVVIKRAFTIANNGSQVLGDSTSSAQLTATPTPTAIVTRIPTSSLSPTLAQTTPTGTQSGTLTPTNLPTYAANASPTTSVTPPVTGDNTLPFAIGSFALIVVGIGLIFVF